MVEVANFCAIFKEHPIAKPVESDGQKHFSFGACGGTIEVDGGDNLVSNAQVDLVCVRVGECVGLPKRHGSIIAG